MTNEQRLQRATERLETAGEALIESLSRVAAQAQVLATEADTLGRRSGDMQKAIHEYRVAFQRVAEKGAR